MTIIFPRKASSLFDTLQNNRIGLDHLYTDISNMETEKIVLRDECEKFKRVVSEGKYSEIYLKNFINKKPFKHRISRAYYEQLNRDLFSRLQQSVKNALKIAKLSIDDIERVILVGGSTRIPKVFHILKMMFKNQLVCYIENQDYAVSLGCAHIASIIHNDEINHSNLFKQNIISNNVLEKTISIKTSGRNMKPIFICGTALPSKEHYVFCTSRKGQTYANIPIYETISPFSNEYILLSKIRIYHLPPEQVGYIHLEMDFYIEKDRILICTVYVKDNNNQLIETRIHNIQTNLDTFITNQRQKLQECLSNIA